MAEPDRVLISIVDHVAHVRMNRPDKRNGLDLAMFLALVATGFAYTRATSPTNNLLEFNRVVPQVRCIRRAGSAALDLAYLAEIEAEHARWSLTDLERQIHTQLFTRLVKSRDKAGVLDLATRGLVLQRPIDAIRAPYVLDFLDLPDAERLHETDLEAAIVDKLQHFLLELGKGFAFVGRQKRLEYEDEYFYVDLVFYNCILKCFLLIDLKMGKLTHQDVGQMDSYVRLFDDRYTTEGDNPTIGLILCAEKNEAVARYSVLHDSEQLFAARYVTYLPTVEELQRELLRERQLIEARRAEGVDA